MDGTRLLLDHGEKRLVLTFLYGNDFSFDQSIIEGAIDVEDTLPHVGDVGDFCVQEGLQLLVIFLD